MDLKMLFIVVSSKPVKNCNSHNIPVLARYLLTPTLHSCMFFLGSREIEMPRFVHENVLVLICSSSAIAWVTHFLLLLSHTLFSIMININIIAIFSFFLLPIRRGEKLYVTKDKRDKSSSNKLCWILCIGLVAGVIILGILAACKINMKIRKVNG
jgi:hypothetical protein